MKNTLTALTLAIVMMFGATFANAGIIVGGKAEPSCNVKQDNGIIVGGFAEIFEQFFGIIVGGRAGIIVGGRPTPCKEVTKEVTEDTTGIIVGG